MKKTVQIIIVLYKCELSESLSFQSLEKQLTEKKSNIQYDLLIYNNDTTRTITHPIYTVVNPTNNKMLAGAYNFALNKAINSKKEWLLLIDQDTEIPEKYFTEIKKFLLNNTNNDIVATVPFLISHNKYVSPEITQKFAWRQNRIAKSGIYEGRVSAFNSMSLLNVKFLSDIGGFNTNYPLDMLDHWLYSQINKNKKKVCVLDVKITHNLSLLDKKNYMPLDRYRNFLLAEKMFVKNELTLLHYISYKFRIILRAGHQLLRFKDKKYFLQTIKVFWGL